MRSRPFLEEAQWKAPFPGEGSKRTPLPGRAQRGALFPQEQKAMTFVPPGRKEGGSLLRSGVGLDPLRTMRVSEEELSSGKAGVDFF